MLVTGRLRAGSSEKQPGNTSRSALSAAAKARATGDKASIVTVPDQGHFELITPGTPAGDAVIEEALRLLYKSKR